MSLIYLFIYTVETTARNKRDNCWTSGKGYGFVFVRNRVEAAKETCKRFASSVSSYCVVAAGQFNTIRSLCRMVAVEISASGHSRE